jgi:predicted metal-dependent phosphoesterase TrpH
VVRQAADAGVDVLALTDHDTVSGWAEAERARPAGLTLVPGIGLSCRHAAVTRGTGHRSSDESAASVHMLGYLFDPEEPVLAAERERLRADRVGRARATVTRLRELGVEITWEQVRRIAGDGVVGRPHIARAMVEAGAVPTADDAFTQDWIGTGGRAHVDHYALDPVRAVSLVGDAGGVCVLAHARARRRGSVVDDGLIEELAAAGLAGIEVDHPDHDASDRAHLRDLAGALGLIPTGASDDHGRSTGHRLGCETTAPEAYEALVASARGK